MQIYVKLYYNQLPKSDSIASVCVLNEHPLYSPLKNNMYIEKNKEEDFYIGIRVCPSVRLSVCT